MSRPGQPRVLVSRWADGWLVGWLAVVVWIVSLGVAHTGFSLDAHIVSAVYWIGAVVGATHFGLSYHLAYSGGAPAMRSRPVALVYGPLALLLILAVVVAMSLRSGGGAAGVTRALITSVYLMTTWHYIKQVYGIGRVGAAYGGITLSAWDVRVLRYGLYPLWFVGAAQVLVRGSAYNLAGFRVGYELLPTGALQLLRLLAICSAIPVAALFVRLAVQRRAIPPGILVAPYVAAFLWLGLPTNPILTLLLLAPFHALQYLAVGHRAEVAVAASQPGTHGVGWWLNIFVGAACGGLLLARWVPSWLDAHVYVHAGSSQLLFPAAFFVFLNLHHYLIDASIWRSKGELVRAMVRKPIAAEDMGQITVMQGDRASSVSA